MKECFYRLAVANPGAVTWYCGRKLEMAVALTRALLTQQLQIPEKPDPQLVPAPGGEAAKDFLQDQLRKSLGDVTVDELHGCGKDWARVDDSYASFEWSGGGMVHVHIALWICGAPRIDKVHVPRDVGGDVEEEHVLPDGAVELDQGVAANRLAAFFDRAYTEWNVLKKEAGNEATPGERSGMTKGSQRQRRSPEMISSEALQLLLNAEVTNPGAEQAKKVDGEQNAWQELSEILSPAFGEAAEVYCG